MNPERAEALALVAQVGVSEAARRLGKPKGTIGRWAAEAKHRNETNETAKRSAPDGCAVGDAAAAGPEMDRDAVLAWMKQTASGPRAASKHFKVPTDLVREMVAEGRAAALANAPAASDGSRSRARPETEDDLDGDDAEVDDLSWPELADLTIDRALRAMARNPNAKGAFSRALIIGKLIDKRAALAAIQRGEATPEAVAQEPANEDELAAAAAVMADVLGRTMVDPNAAPDDILDDYDPETADGRAVPLRVVVDND